jgi:fused signal recognition particle receptor
MFSFFRKKPPAVPAAEVKPDAVPDALEPAPAPDTTTAGPSLAAIPAAEALPAAAPPPLAVVVSADQAAPQAPPDVPAVPAPSPETATETPAAIPSIDKTATSPAEVTAPAQPLAPALSSTPAPVAVSDIAPPAAPISAAEPSAASRPRWWTPPWSKTTAAPVAPQAPVQAPSGPQSPAPDANLAPAADGVAPTPPAPTLSPTVPRPAPAVAATLSSPAPSTPPPAAADAAVSPAVAPAPTPEPEPAPAPAAERKGWLDKLKAGLRKTGSSLATVFTGTRIDDELYEELETALLMADTGVKATEFLLADLKRRVKENKTTDPAAVKGLLADAITDLLAPLQKVLVVGDRPDNLHNGQHGPTVIMVAGVNGAGKTTSIGKLTKHLATSGASVLLAAADTFRAAAREQLAVWADRNLVEIISQQGGDPAAVSFDAVSAGRARGKDVVLVDTAGRLPTQLHLMEELKKIKRVVQKADATAPHEVLLVIDGNTGQNALTQVKAFDDALALTGLVITKLDGTAKGGVLCAIAREKPVPVYFIGVGEKLEDLETFNAREFAQALLS